jgi:hypothetical protein
MEIIKVKCNQTNCFKASYCPHARPHNPHVCVITQCPVDKVSICKEIKKETLSLEN